MLCKYQMLMVILRIFKGTEKSIEIKKNWTTAKIFKNFKLSFKFSLIQMYIVIKDLLRIINRTS